MRTSGQDAVDDVAVDVGEAVIAALVVEREPFVVEAETVEDGGLEVVDVDRVFSDVESEVVGGTVGSAWADPAAGHPHGVGLGVVVAAHGAA